LTLPSRNLVVSTDRVSTVPKHLTRTRSQHGDRRDPGVEGNARLTAITGLVLLVMLAAEGFTILSIRPLLSWHVAIGLALIPPVALKLGSTVWRFSRYYLGDVRYRRAGPPQPILRVIGPFVVLTTVAVLATGVAAWLAGPHNGPYLTLHQASFFLWFAAMTIHVLGHFTRATRLAAADVDVRGAAVRYRGVRWSLVGLSLVAGLIVALATRGVVTGWTGYVPHHG
jgi:hypothetical protein